MLFPVIYFAKLPTDMFFLRDLRLRGGVVHTRGVLICFSCGLSEISHISDIRFGLNSPDGYHATTPGYLVPSL